jgi:hypothetical protein
MIALKLNPKKNKKDPSSAMMCGRNNDIKCLACSGALLRL